MKLWIKWAGGIIGSILIGAIGSGVWSNIFVCCFVYHYCFSLWKTRKKAGYLSEAKRIENLRYKKQDTNKSKIKITKQR